RSDRQQVRRSGTKAKIAADRFRVSGSDLYLLKPARTNSLLHLSGEVHTSRYCPSIDLGTICSARKWIFWVKRLFADRLIPCRVAARVNRSAASDLELRIVTKAEAGQPEGSSNRPKRSVQI